MSRKSVIWWGLVIFCSKRALAAFIEQQKLTASDASGVDQFGGTAAISGDLLIVGAEGHDDHLGAAYIFARNQSGARNWQEVKRITSRDPLEEFPQITYFGRAVSISDEFAVVGAPIRGGFASIFGRNEGGADNWGEIKKLVEGGLAGSSVSIDGDFAVVGAMFDGSAASGAAYIFARNQGGDNNWGQVRKLTTVEGDHLGTSASISGDFVIVGASQGYEDGFPGTAYIFARNQGGLDNWGEVKKLVASDSEINDYFGGSVAIFGDIAIVGASLSDDAGNSTGSAYIFERNQGGVDNWGEVKKLVASNAAADDHFGDSVSISGDVAVIGARGHAPGGASYIFARDHGGIGNWGEVKKLSASDGAAGDGFGSSVSISSETVIVGAVGDDDDGPLSGSTYVFEYIPVTNSPQTNVLSTSPPSDGELSIGAIIGGIVGGIFLLMFIFGVFNYHRKRNSQSQKTKDHSHPDTNAPSDMEKATMPSSSSSSSSETNPGSDVTSDHTLSLGDIGLGVDSVMDSVLNIQSKPRSEKASTPQEQKESQPKILPLTGKYSSNSKLRDAQVLSESSIAALEELVDSILAIDSTTSSKSSLELLKSSLQTLAPLINNQSNHEILYELDSTLDNIGNNLSLLLAEHHKGDAYDTIEEINVRDQTMFLLVLRSLETEVLTSVGTLENYITKFGGSITRHDVSSLKRSSNVRYYRLIRKQLEKEVSIEREDEIKHQSSSVEEILNADLDEIETSEVDVTALLDRYCKSTIVHSSSSKSGINSNTSNSDSEIPFEELQISETLGKGGFGVVVKAIWKPKNQPVALKTLQGRLSVKVMLEFGAEINRWKALEQENIIQLVGSSIHPETHQPCFVMELMDTSLNDFLYNTDNCNMDLFKVCKIGIAVAKGLAFLHKNMIIHRDIKPQNVLLRDGLETIKLCDFGLSTTKTESSSTAMGSNAQLGGTPAYMAPELFEGTSSFKLDMFSFGIMLGEITEGQKPFSGCAPFQIAFMIRDGKRPKLDQSKEKYPAWLIRLIEKCWSDDRYSRPSPGFCIRTFVSNEPTTP